LGTDNPTGSRIRVDGERFSGTHLQQLKRVKSLLTINH
jgi:hypothetical protein